MTDNAGKPLMDPDKGTWVFTSGRKGQGKSVLCRLLADSFPYDVLIIDVTGDLAAAYTADQIPFAKITPESVPVSWPLDPEGRRQLLIYVPDMGSSTALDDIDRIIGLAYRHGRVMVWIDETGIVCKVGQVGPEMTRVLHHGRHRELSLLLAGLRPMKVDPMCISQADHTFTFHTPNPRDRERIAENIGYEPREFDDAVHDLGDHEYLWWSVADQQLTHMPAIPREMAPRTAA